ncbi:MAG: NADP-dependent malic enzyme [Deltaproteobacteria bacterium]|nr:NADP-dependent malic enzyme [Deltaproteobacteria bacterium]
MSAHKSSKIRPREALTYHSRGRPGKIEVVPTKPVATARDLSLAYSPGVAEPCLEIAKDPSKVFDYTARGNLVAVISNGTAVLGLGDIGPEAGKPVMEGKGVLFKRFADIDVFDIEVAETDVDAFCKVVKALEPTFGGINLEDIKAPECFEIEARLREEMDIPVFHDDQHGTAIISGAALLNALEIAGKKIEEVTVTVSGAGASALACAHFYVSLGVKKENILLCDSKGVVSKERAEGMNPYKAAFARETDKKTLAEAMEGVDVFLGCSVAGLVTVDMVKSMADRPLVFALANPDPEIPYPDAVAARDDLIMGTGRSDYPNQINNVLGFPFIFRGALDARATTITEGMKRAAAQALADLARQEVPESVTRAYGDQPFRFGPEYIIPKPFDPRVLLWVAPAVAKAAMEDGVARRELDIDAYREALHARVSRPHAVMQAVFNKARQKKVRIAFPEGDSPKILQAADILLAEGICQPVLIGSPEKIRQLAESSGLGLEGIEIVDPDVGDTKKRYADRYHAMRARRGVLRKDVEHLIQSRNLFAAMMLEEDAVDGVVDGLNRHYGVSIKPYLEVIKVKPEVHHASGCYIMVFKDSIRFIADATVNPDPDARTLADIAVRTAALARYFDVEPRIAMLSFANFGRSDLASPRKVREATEILHARHPDLNVDGEIQVDAALLPELRAEAFPFSKLEGSANVLVFPNLDAANMAYKLLWRLGGADAIGPILTGMRKPVNILQMDSDVDDIVNLAAITAVRAISGSLSG